MGPEEHQRLRVAFRHVHVPMLVEAGLVEREGETVELVRLDDALRELIDAALAYDRQAAERPSR